MRRAFTFIELLVVIAIIAILAWILMPVLSDRSAARSAVINARNIRDVAMATMLYTDDHDNRYVPVGAPSMDPCWSPATNQNVDAAGKPWNGWGLKLARYAKGNQVFLLEGGADHVSFSGGCESSKSMKVTNAYSMNWFLGRDGSYKADGYGKSPTGVVLNRPITTDMIHIPANTISIQISSRILEPGSSDGCLRLTLQASDFTNHVVIPPATKSGTTVAFADGHVRMIESGNLAASSAGQTLYDDGARSLWMQPTMPEDNLGYKNTRDLR